MALTEVNVALSGKTIASTTVNFLTPAQRLIEPVFGVTATGSK